MNADEQAIRDVIAEWHRATAAADVGAVLRLMADDVVFLVPGKPPLTGRSAFETGLRHLLKSNRIDSKGDVQEIQVSGDLAFSWTRLTVSITPRSGGTANVRNGSALSIFRKQTDGSWVLVRDANLLPPP
jgi:uncharacterized protein (TIGR02246 family)